MNSIIQTTNEKESKRTNGNNYNIKAITNGLKRSLKQLKKRTSKRETSMESKIDRMKEAFVNTKKDTEKIAMIKDKFYERDPMIEELRKEQDETRKK